MKEIIENTFKQCYNFRVWGCSLMANVTIYDVAGAAKVSLATVSRVLNNPEKVKPETRERVLRVINELGYRPNAIARGLASRKTTTVGVIASDLSRASVAQMLSGISDIAKNYKYSMKLFTISDANDVDDVMRNVIAEQVDGVLYLNDELEASSVETVINMLESCSIPMVLTNVVLPNKNIPSVSIDYEEAGYEACKRLIDEGRKNIYLLSTIRKYTVNDCKEAGYEKAMKEAGVIIEQNKQLQKENARLTEENDGLKKRIASIDENAITRLRDKKDAEIKELQERIGKAESEAVRSSNKAYSEHQRAENAESQVKEMLDIPEIKEIWESIQRNKEDFSKQIDKWIEDGVAAIRNYADGKDNDFQAEQGNAVAWGIIAKAFEYGLDPTDEKQRKIAAAYLLEKVSWTDISSDFKISLTSSRTQQLCDAMTVSKDMMANLLLAAGGRGGICTGGGGSTSELTNWDGTKKNTGWGI